MPRLRIGYPSLGLTAHLCRTAGSRCLLDIRGYLPLVLSRNAAEHFVRFGRPAHVLALTHGTLVFGRQRRLMYKMPVDVGLWVTSRIMGPPELVCRYVDAEGHATYRCQACIGKPFEDDNNLNNNYIVTNIRKHVRYEPCCTLDWDMMCLPFCST